MNKIEFFFDCSSPWTYLAFESVQGVVKRNPAVQLIYRPILVGGVFNAVNQSVYENRANPVPVKAAYYNKDLQDWAQYAGVEISIPPVFPVNSVKAMRGALVAIEEGKIVDYARETFKAYWSDHEDISQLNVIAGIAERAGLESGNFIEKINDSFYKDGLRKNTEELIERKGFGSPTFFLNNDDMYFGNDRIPLLEARLNQTSD